MTDGMIEAAFSQRLGSILTAKRKQRRLSQCDVAAMIGVHRNTLRRWEEGDCKVDIWSLLRLADVLSVNHLLLLPPREFTWGTELRRAELERDGTGRATQAERDPELTAKEVA